MSTLNVANITDGSTTVATEYVVNGSAKAWVNFNGTGTIAARDSFNVASLLDSGNGLYRVNLTNAMSNNSFAGTVWSGDYTNQTGPTGVTQTTTSFDFYTVTYGSTSFQDATQAHVVIHGDLA